MDEIIKNLALQAPAIAILLIFVVTLYRDMRKDAEAAAKQREETIAALRSLEIKISQLCECLSEAE